MYTVELCGSNAARCPELNVEVNMKKNGVIDVIAREMIKAGADPEQFMNVVRNDTPVFNKDRKVGEWAAERLYESATQGFLKQVYRPHKLYGDGG